MKTHEFINTEFQMLLEREVAEHFDETGAQQLLKWVDDNLYRELDELDELDDFLDRAQKNENLSRLPITSLVLKILRKFDDDEIDEKDYASVLEALEQNPNIKLLHFLRVMTQAEVLEVDQPFRKDKLDFLEDLFYNHGYIVRLDDFFTCINGGLTFLTYDGIEKYHEQILRLFEYAVKTYPEKRVFKHFLGTIYYFSGRYEDAIKQYGSLLESVNTSIENDSFYDIDYSHLLFPQDIQQQMAFCYYKLGKNEKTLDLLNKVIEDLPVLSGPDEDDEEFEDVYSYLDSFLLRMRINISSGKMEAVFSDWSRIKKSLPDISYYEKQYPDVFKTVHDAELQKKFLKEGTEEFNP